MKFAAKKNGIKGKRLQQKTLPGSAAFWAALMVNAVCVLICIEAISHDSYSNALIWILENSTYALCNWGLIVLALAVLVLLFGHMYPAVLLGNSIFLAIGIVQRFKLEMRGDPFKLTDLHLFKEAALAISEFWGHGKMQFSGMMIQFIVLLSVCLPLLFIGARVFVGKPVHRGLCLLAAACSLGCCVMVMPTLNLSYGVAWEDYWRRGLMISFLDAPSAMEEPDGYDQQNVQAVLAGHVQERTVPDVLPHVLFIMSESLFDLTDDLQLSEDPMAYFKELQDTYWGGKHLSSVYGGGTASVEYEVLTGYRASDTNWMTYAADRGVIRADMRTLVSQFSSYGYYTQAIHPNTGSFYSRDTVYKLLGFDDMLFQESLEPAPKEVFPFPSDEYLFEQVIQAFEARPEGQPWFCYTITYQNHGGYAFESDLSDVCVETPLEDEEMLNARNFVNLLKLSDIALRDLIEYFDRLEEPTVIVIFGDHAPTVSQFGIELPQDRQERMHYQTMPLLVYNNYGLDVSSLPEAIPSYRLGAQILRLIGMNDDPYLNYVGSDAAVSLTHMNGLISRDGEVIVDYSLYKEESQKLYLLHYDRLYGENYGERL